ncbi:cell envelope biogenesis protein OmpA [Flavobacterium magnum]|uniref:Cell envelope biogenesis protein OmpA n=1 Tax=Flavobacterium magnum TaxID=2162713 RepID=A0A2S0RFI7_9FLAO|nr:OmpA family protein [Flavobacterium magnum]AWA30385.1 cell envelope biogenesis protein OmpA [Flavobacterium magnum]
MRIILLTILLLRFVPCLSQESFAVYFDSNQFSLTQKERARLDHWIAANKESKIVAVNGYTDEDGTTGFNDTLAKKRVDFIVSLLKGNINIRDDFKTRSFGETFQSSRIKAENRKVTIYYLLAKDLHRENEILGIVPKSEVPKPKVRQPIRFPTNIAIDNPNGTKTSVQLDTLFMQKVNLAKAGDKLQIENLNFRINTFIVVPESVPKMYELLLVLQSNPDLNIRILGHLCCMPSDKQDLSTQRAKAVYSFLTAYGIPKDRLSYKGLGVTQPLFPIPEKNEAERAANRRVEIEIIAN